MLNRQNFENFVLKLKQINLNRLLAVLAALLILDILVFWQLLAGFRPADDLNMFFIEVGQGDSQLAILPGGVKMLIDGGSANGLLLAALGRILPPFDRYIDLIVLSHSQTDHFGGLIEILKRYRIGAFVYNGEEGSSPAWNDLKEILAANQIKVVALGGGDRISYLESRAEILWPPSGANKKDTNDRSLVLALTSAGAAVLFTGDISAAAEKELLKFYSQPVDILKVAHHGSKYSSSAAFLRVLKPRLALIEVGKNSYGHPTPEVLERLAQTGAMIFRTDRDGTINLKIDGGKIEIFKGLKF